MIAAGEFEHLAWLTGYNAGVPDLQVANYPGAFDLHSDEQLRENIEEVTFPQIVEGLTTQIETGEEISEEQDPRDIVFKGSFEEVNQFFVEMGWSDGMAIAPPTVERVEEFLKYTDYLPHEEIATLPRADTGHMRATPWNIAVNGVMAGCQPEHMPILIAFIKAMSKGSNDDLGSSGTHSNIPFMWINGPIARQLGIDFGQGLITHPTNQVLGRAISLIIRNVADFRIKEFRLGSFGYPVSWVLAEDENYLDMIGWKPYHMERGFGKNQNTLTVAASCMWGQNGIPSSSDPERIVQIISYDIVYGEGFASGSIGSARTVLITPPTAKVLAAGGYTKESLISEIIKNARKLTYEWTFSQVFGSPGFVYPSFEEQLQKNLQSAEIGKLPPWYPPEWGDMETTASVREGRIEILVCGPQSRNKSQTMAGPGASSPRAIVEIELPGNWDELMQDLGYPPLESFYK